MSQECSSIGAGRSRRGVALAAGPSHVGVFGRVALAAVISGLASPLLALQEPARTDQGAPTFSETVDVRVVNVEVVVENRKGERVHGLTADDFELEVDGEVVPIEYFTEVIGGRAADSATGQRAVPGYDSGARVGTSYLVFIDEFFSEPVDLRLVLESLAEQLVNLASDDRMAIVAYDGTDLDMLTTWTDSQRELERALREARGRKARGLQRVAELRQARFSDPRNFEPTRNDALETRLSLEERSYASRLEDQTRRVVAATTATMRGFAAPPGRKVLVLLSGGWPFDPVQFVVNDLTRPIIEGELGRGRELFDAIPDTANQLGYTVYALDVNGQQFSGLVGADARQPRTVGSDGFIRETSVHNTLQFLASETGGRALLDGRRRGALERIIDDTRSYYWLGFVPDRQGDDSRHDVEVRLADRSLKVRARGGFFDFSKETEITTAVESALYFGSPPTPNPLIVLLGKPEGGKRKMRVPIEIRIPMDAVTLLPIGSGTDAGRFGGSLEIRIAVLDEDGATAGDVPVIPLQFELRTKPDAGVHLPWQTELLMRRKPHSVVVAVYDTVSGSLLSTSLDVQPQ